MFFRCVWGVVSLLTTILSAQRCEDDRPLVGGYQGLLGGCIDPITGAFYDFEEDLRVHGSTLYIARSHSSNEPGWFSTRSAEWRDWQRPCLNLFSRWGSNISTLLYNKTFYREVMVQDISGYHLTFLHDTSRIGTLKGDLLKSWNNLSSIREGARGDAHNHKVHFDGLFGGWAVRNPQGIKRLFASHPFSDGKKEGQTWICAETERWFPNGLKWNFLYQSNSGGPLSSTKLVSINEIDCEGEKIQTLELSNQGLRISSSSGQWVEYKTKSATGYPDLLVEVRRSTGPSISYEYLCPEMTFSVRNLNFQSDSDDHEYWHVPPPRITRKVYQEGKYRRMEYKPFQDVRVFPGQPFLYHKFDGCISAYYGPVGKDGKEEAIYKLDYYPSKTEVTHGDGKFEVYEYDGESFLRVYREYDSKKVCKRSKVYNYCQKEPGKGRVLSETLSDESQKNYFHNAFEYDSYGNVIKKTSSGGLKNRDVSLIVKPSGEIDLCSEVDSYVVNFRYGLEPLHLKQEEIYPDGRRTLYVYEEGTDRLLAKLNYFHETLLERHFYKYDQYAQIVLEIHDDGSSQDPSNLEGVYHRKWIKREVFNKEPFKGLVKSEQMYVYDVDHECDILLQQFEYAYNSSRLVISKKGTECILGNQFELLYEYDAKGNVIREVDSRGAIVSRCFDLDGLPRFELGPIPGYEKFYQYDKDRRLIKTLEKRPDYPGVEWVTSYEYDFMGRITKVVDPCGIETENSYDWAGRIVTQTRRGVPNETSSGLTTYCKEFRYDADNRRIYEKNEEGFESECVFNMLSQPLYTKNQLGLIERYVYDDVGRLIEKSQEGGSREFYFYNERGQLASVDIEADGKRYTLTSFEYEGAYKSVQTDALGHRDFWKYDGLGNVLEHCRLDIESAQESKEQFVYDGLSRLITKRVWQNASQYVEYHTRYSPAGDVLNRWVENSSGDKYNITHFEYDLLGRCLSSSQEIDQGIATTSIKYDSLGNKTLITDQEGYQTHIEYTYLLGKSGDGIAVIAKELRPDKVLIETHLDTLGNILCYRMFDENEVLKKSQRFGYNFSGQVVFRAEKAIIQDEVSDASEDGNWVLTRVLYGPGGHVIKRWDNYQALLERLRTWEYNPRGFCTKKTEPSGLKHEYSYDQRGFMTACTSSDGTIDYTYEHDELGRLLKVTNQLTHKATSRSYDAWGRITKDVLEEGYVFQREWNLIGQPVKDIYPEGQEVVRQYKGEWLVSTQVGDDIHQIQSYNKQGIASLEAQPRNLGYLSSSYDVKGRLISFAMPGYEASNIAYNERGDLVSRRLLDATLQTYKYDVLSQLESERGNCDRVYKHDSRQRRLAQNDKIVHIDDLDQLLSVTKEDQTEETFDYDLDGHLTQAQQSEDHTWQYTYDAWSRLIRITTPDFTVKYAYDAFNRRTLAVYEQAGTIEEKRFGYLEQRLACVYSDSKVDERYFVRAIASERGDTLSWKSNDDIYFPIHDMSGSCIGWRDINGNTVDSWSFDCFGISLGTKFGPWGCWGKYQDEFTGMIYFGARDYIPAQGRWLTRDPKGEIDGSNVYAFVGNNPVTRHDEWGTTWQAYTGQYANELFKPFDWGVFLSNHISMMYADFDPQIRDAYDDFYNDVSICDRSCLVVARYNESDKNPRGSILSVNGIKNLYPDVVERAINTSIEAKCDVYHVYNISHNGLFDGLKALMQRKGFEIITGAERVTIAALRIIHKEHPAEGILVMPHSHGNQVVANVVNLNQDNADMKPVLKSCHVRAMAGSGVVKDPLLLGSCKNTVCTNDIVVRMFDGGAIDKQRELGILDEPKPSGSFWESLIPDHTLKGETCTNAYNESMMEWKRAI